MNGYAKLFSSILDSTVWRLNAPDRLVWITMLAMADRDGVVESSVPGLADRARVSRAECERALALFLAPDPDSRTPDHEGRRIAPVHGGWVLLNYEHYREKQSAEDKRAKDAERQRRKRERDAVSRDASRLSRSVTAVTQSHTSGSGSGSGSAAVEERSAPAAPAAPAAAEPEIQEPRLDSQSTTPVDIMREWLPRAQAGVGGPVAHSLKDWRDDYATIAGAIDQLPLPARKPALLALVTWFWCAGSGPVASGRLKPSRATPATLAKNVTSDLASAHEWWVAEGKVVYGR